MRRKLMDTLYVRIKDNIVHAIERSSFATYAQIDLREANLFELCPKKEIHLYSRIIAELESELIHKGKYPFLYVNQDQNLLAYTPSKKPWTIA